MALNNIKQKVKSEITPAPLKQQVINFVGLLIVAATVFLVIKFGWIAGVVFVVLALVAGLVLGKKGI